MYEILSWTCERQLIDPLHLISAVSFENGAVTIYEAGCAAVSMGGEEGRDSPAQTCTHCQSIFINRGSEQLDNNK